MMSGAFGTTRAFRCAGQRRSALEIAKASESTEFQVHRDFRRRASGICGCMVGGAHGGGAISFISRPHFRTQDPCGTKQNYHNIRGGSRSAFRIGRGAGSRWMSNESMPNDQKQERTKDSPGATPQTQEKKGGDVHDQFAPKNQVHMDFFGEPVTFLAESKQTNPLPTSTVHAALAALDGMILAVTSKGQSCIGGGSEYGESVKAAHSHALTWAELIRHATVWSDRSPMLACVAVAPMLVQTGVPYVKHIDELLKHTVEESLPKSAAVSLFDLAVAAVAQKDNEILNDRERSHLRAMDCILRNDNIRAMRIFEQHLQRCPGDVLALSLAMDLCHTLGDKPAALRIAGAVAAYWNDRRGSIFRPGLPGYNMTACLVAVGLAVGGRYEDAERLALMAMGSKLNNVSSGLGTWALAHVFDAQGRTAEGISACANSDGATKFEGCGQLFFDCVLSGYGVRFALDREQRGRGGQSVGLRLYDNNYERLFDSSGFTHGVLFDIPHRQAPKAWKVSDFATARDSGGFRNFFMQRIFGTGTKQSSTTEEDPAASKNDSAELIVEDGKKVPMPRKNDEWVPVIEDVLTWLPPTPRLMTDATMLLLRMTLNGTIASRNFRWDHVRNGWSALFELQKRHRSSDAPSSFEFNPLASVTAAMLSTPEKAGATEGAVGRLGQGLHKMAKLLKLGSVTLTPDQYKTAEDTDELANSSSYIASDIFREIVAETQPEFWLPVVDEEKKKEWRQVMHLLSSGIDGVYSPMAAEGELDVDMDYAEFLPPFESSWEFDVRPVLEHAVVYAACKCGDIASLSIARSICSRGVTLRGNSPEEWWRYSIVLGLLGDEVASEDARAASIALGTGQGATRSD